MHKRFVPALILAASALAGAAIAATAQPPGDPMDPPAGMSGPGPGEGGPGHHPGFMRHDFDPAAHIEGRLAFLKAELKIKPAQESAWSDYATALRKSTAILSQARPQGKSEDRGEWKPLPVPARLDRAEQRLNAHMEALKAIKGPATKLYDSLDDGQKKTADELIMQRMAMR